MVNVAISYTVTVMTFVETTQALLGYTVPMHTKVITNQDLLHSLMSGQPLPTDDGDHYFSPTQEGSPASSTSIASKETEITGRTCEEAKVLVVTNFLYFRLPVSLLYSDKK